MKQDSPSPGQHGNRPVAVQVVIWHQPPDGDIQVLLLKRKPPHGVWQSLTGRVQDDETPEQAARREVRDQTGFVHCHLTGGEPVDTRDHLSEGSHREYRFSIDFPATPAPRFPTTGAEYTDWQWLPARQAANKVFSRSHRMAIEALLR